MGQMNELPQHDVPTLSGAFAPIAEERVIDDLEIEGEVPADLSGMYVRNGPNRRFEAAGRYHWFDGDGMLHAVRFDRGRVQYRNRWVMTSSLAVRPMIARTSAISSATAASSSSR